LKKEKETKVGRPSVIDKKKKSSHVYLNLTAKEKEKLQKAAEAENRSLSQLCIHVLKKAKYL
jgi:uncharacterized protein (DUF1778 family)